ncbi:MAG: hypothetical protein A2992_01825 [Elusimicrobia bacterium RIFCSPLOWO2_01_FULL_59_12]|nr:MAG: hypothetical protein A2992_01825 [Elusimicrobia bacterium RIFCSPLOWO2_01_FULL_59_12]
MENKNLLLAIILSVGFLFFWSTFVIPKYAPPAKLGTPAAPAPLAAGQAGKSMLYPAHAVPLVNQPESILRDELNEIVLSPKGGGVHHWRLKLKGREVDLAYAPGVEPLPLTAFPDAVFTIRQHGREAVMQTTLQNGLRITQWLTLNPAGYLHDVSFLLENPTSQPIQLKDWDWSWGPGLGTTVSEQKENSGLIRALSTVKMKANVLKPGDHPFGEWAAIDNRYFLVAFLPASPDLAGSLSLHVEGAKDKTILKVRHNVTVPARGSLRVPYQIYAGPKGYTQLGHYHKGLEAAVDFGWFSSLGKLVLKSVYWLQSKTKNYGWAIIILTIILQILMLPLTIKSFRATMAMKELQPQIAALQKAYKSDPKRLNIEMMNLYKKSGTNPFGGCLPMLLQLPIFWALFTTLRNAYELQGAPFAGWIKDLSVADPFHVLPIVMGLGMLLQSRMSGAVTDPTQRQMMYLMPVIFTVMFWSFPSGLVLYWFTQSLVTMGIQWGMLRAHRPKQPTFELVK